MSLAALLKSTITLQRSTMTKDASGGASRSWANVAAGTNVKADIQPASSSVQFRYQQRSLFVSHTIFLATDIGALETDRITFGSRIFKIVGYRKGDPGRASWPAVADVEEEPTS